jgi:hypothetical protein
MLMEFLYRFCHITQAEIGQIAGGIDYSAVSQARGRLRKYLSQNKELKQKFEAIERQLLELSRIKI